MLSAPSARNAALHHSSPGKGASQFQRHKLAMWLEMGLRDLDKLFPRADVLPRVKGFGFHTRPTS
jgi:hypothetical protein